MASFLPQDPAKQRKLLIGMAPLLLVGLYYYFLHGDYVAEADTMQTRLEALQAQNAAAQIQARQGGPELANRLALYEEHMTRLEQLIPSKEEVPELLHELTLRAQETNVDIALLRPDAEQPGAHYNKQIYEMSVIGTYHDVGAFLTAVGSLPRIITPVDLQVKTRGQTNRTGQILLEVGFRIETYILPAPPPAAPPQATPNATT